MEGVSDRESRSPSRWAAVEAILAEGRVRASNLVNGRRRQRHQRTELRGRLQREDNARGSGGETAKAGGRHVQAPSSGEIGGPLEHEAGSHADQRVLVFDMWIADAGQTHLWLVGCAASKDTRGRRV